MVETLYKTPRNYSSSLIFLDFAVREVFGIEADDYEIHLQDTNISVVSFSDISYLYFGFTLCFWLKSEHTGFFIEYKVTFQQGGSFELGLYCGNNTFSVHDETTKRYKKTFLQKLIFNLI